jgi:hypothetical protein
MQALKGLWQFWFWTPDDAVKSKIEDVFLSSITGPQHPWVEQNLREGIYNIADENIRYLYNNWVPLLARDADRERVIAGRLKIEDRLASKFARVLADGSNAQRKVLLAALTQYPLRRFDVYDPKADLTSGTAPVYNRIGNDIEQIVFFGKSNTAFAKALQPLIDSTDSELRELAINASILVRDVKYPTVRKVSGEPGSERDILVDAVYRAQPNAQDVLEALGKIKPVPKPKTAAKIPLLNSGPADHEPAKPSEAYFNANVRPILEKKGKDGYACVQCHATHTLFNGSYATAMNVVDLRDPENSLILKKPTSTAETEGITGSKITAHGGGVRWPAGSQEYNTILNWIRGAQ